jgi:HPt (histidine-containing phosphotransfer) domain-containing protein
MEDTDSNQNERHVVRADPEIADLIPEFLEMRQEDVKTILEALEKNDFKTIYILAHSMKGSGGGYGFDRISVIGNFLEDAAENKDPEECLRVVNVLANYLANVKVIY